MKKVKVSVEEYSLNPCFVGICKDTLLIFAIIMLPIICLNPCFVGICKDTSDETISAKTETVLILVLLEYVRIPFLRRIWSPAMVCLNPCFVGICKDTHI